MLLSIVGTVVTLLAGIAVAYTVRVAAGAAPAVLARIASLGYAVPGTVLAIGLLPLVTGIEGLWTARPSGSSTDQPVSSCSAAAGPLSSPTPCRFLALASGSVESGLSRVPVALDDAARTMGEGTRGRLRRIHLPLTRPALATAALLIFVDGMKELPATLLLRPLGVETLATLLYGEAVRGTYEEAAVAALLIVVPGLVPVIVLARVSRARPGEDVSL